MIGSAAFQPQAAAFTSLLHMCAKAKLWQKALEVGRPPSWFGLSLVHALPQRNSARQTRLRRLCKNCGLSMRASATMRHKLLTSPGHLG